VNGPAHQAIFVHWSDEQPIVHVPPIGAFTCTTIGAALLFEAIADSASRASGAIFSISTRLRLAHDVERAADRDHRLVLRRSIRPPTDGTPSCESV
jgi:hypothetical protein